ncbi:MAG: hypothetical protein HW390_2148 [Candidatus Brocadiaceae bacterium]|nr:hypothetical protein [Candidatus Brocadiaceae bacterium]
MSLGGKGRVGNATSHAFKRVGAGFPRLPPNPGGIRPLVVFGCSHVGTRAPCPYVNVFPIWSLGTRLQGRVGIAHPTLV